MVDCFSQYSTLYVPFDESVSDVIVSLDFGRKESLGTMEDVHQDGELCLLHVTPFIVDVRHHILCKRLYV